jgi:molybdopterin/thiamine biosynthesis adenylyltransferase/rhodanese-related sulfurtransferase
MSHEASARYARQIAVPEIGVEGQRRIGAASVLVVGAGGLGCAVLPYLCAAGVGRLILVDHDRVEESNLHRQPLYRMLDVGEPKVVAAAAALAGLNPHVEIETRCERLTPANASALVSGANLIVDAADSFAVTYILSDECERVGKSLVSASVLGLSGYAGAFCGDAPSYRAVFPELPQVAGTCAGSGVLGTAVGVMGTLQAQITLALLMPALQADAAGRLITVDFRTLRFSGFSFRSARDDKRGFHFIAPEEVEAGDVAVELRDLQEAPVRAVPGSIRLAVEHIESLVSQLNRSTRVVLCCRTGLRAWRAAERLRAVGHENIALIAAGD